ncbi:SprT family protein [Domibacillus sp. PGB-M46]|uniref:SprT family protein n=1 Tax=Domibacillus sp. PGB-M46 TaxID=2910255 RepID=UPI001F5601A7|nr:SprT family protein [Domibacillus sp. PGB-M46]MCI2255910.1 SprT family protein [Domibacillus sp. PGB-M46]
MKTSDKMIQKLTEELSERFFNRPFLHRAYINKRLRTTGGRYLLVSHNIEVNEKYIEAFGKEELIGILKHELCHYHLHLQGKGYKHGDEDFKELLKQTGSPRHCRTLPEQEGKQKQRKIVFYKCSGCGIKYKRYRRINTSRYVCGACRGALKEIIE